jgi:hypothetical protein
MAAMNLRAYRTSIPKHATEVVGSRYPNGSKKTAAYTVDGEMVGYREWQPDGHLDFEYGLRNGDKHGYEYRFHENGNLLEKERCRHGRLHGVGKQWAEDGRLLVTWKMVNACGLDLWCDEEGHLAQEHLWPRSGELGYKRLWTGDEWTVYEEYFFMLGKGYHGIWRKWNARGLLKRGFPWFFVADRRVRMREYLQARETDTSLPPYLAAADAPHRCLPEEYLRQRRQR